MKQHGFFLLVLFSIASIHAQSQNNRYVIVLKDKKGTPYSFSNPSAYLSQRAIARRTRYNIVIDSTDLPVTPVYLESIRQVPNVTIINVAKWLNQVCIQTSDANALATIMSFPFVKSSALIAKRVGVNPIKNKPMNVFEEHSILQTNEAEGVNGVLDDHFNYGNNYSQISFHQGQFLHNLGFHGEGVVIAILDAGFTAYKTNPVFDSVRNNHQILGTWDYVSNNDEVNEDDLHGAYCFSIIAANSPGKMIGTAPKANFWLLRTEDTRTEYPIEEQNWAVGAAFADSAGADMISSSLGYDLFDDPIFDHSHAQRDGNTAISTIAADLAARKGMLVTAAAGNSGADLGDSKYVSCPGDADSVLTVGACAATPQKIAAAGFSSWGPNGAGKQKPNIISVGVSTAIASIGGTVVNGDGTSFATPNICGLIACLWQAFPELSNMDIIDAVQKSSHIYNHPDMNMGYGAPDLKKAFSALITKAFQGNATVDGCTTTLNWTSKDNSLMQYIVERKTNTDADFVRVGTVPGKTSNFNLNSYELKDMVKTSSATDVSYRLKVVMLQDTTVLLFNTTHPVDNSCAVLTKSFTVSPNPFNGNISIDINATISNMSVVLTDAAGKTVYQYKGSANGYFSLPITTKTLPSGIYLLTIRDGNKVLFTKKLVK